MKYHVTIVKAGWTAIVILWLLSICPAMQARIGFQTREDADESDVYSAVINRAVLEAKAKFAVIGRTTVFDKRSIQPENANALLALLKPMTQGMLDDLIRKNKEPRQLAENLKLNVHYVLLPSRNNDGKTSTQVWPAA